MVTGKWCQLFFLPQGMVSVLRLGPFESDLGSIFSSGQAATGCLAMCRRSVPQPSCSLVLHRSYVHSRTRSSRAIEYPSFTPEIRPMNSDPQAWPRVTTYTYDVGARPEEDPPVHRRARSGEADLPHPMA